VIGGEAGSDRSLFDPHTGERITFLAIAEETGGVGDHRPDRRLAHVPERRA
jgi:hypothetical protein